MAILNSRLYFKSRSWKPSKEDEGRKVHINREEVRTSKARKKAPVTLPKVKFAEEK